MLHNLWERHQMSVTKQSQNGKPVNRTQDAAKRQTHARKSQVKGIWRKFKIGGGVALGCAIPFLVLLVSHLSHAAFHKGLPHYPLGFFGVFVCASILFVSLKHTSEAVRDLTCSTGREGWAMAIALDLGLVFGETARFFLPEQATAIYALIGIVAIFSAMANSYGFTHKS